MTNKQAMVRVYYKVEDRNGEKYKRLPHDMPKSNLLAHREINAGIIDEVIDLDEQGNEIGVSKKQKEQDLTVFYDRVAQMKLNEKDKEIAELKALLEQSKKKKLKAELNKQ